MLKISAVDFMWNPEICHEPTTCDQNDLVLLTHKSKLFFSFPIFLDYQFNKWQNKSYISKTSLIIVFTLGFCLCDRGFGGADCSLDLTQGPHVTALDNLGLCDVRTKPCRDVIVVAEQLATKAAEDELKCIIEIYKVSLWFLKLLQMILG